MCAPVIALVEIATGGMLTSAVSGILGSQVLGGAVVGLIASGGNPIGALTGGLAAGLGSFVSPGIDSAATAGDYVNAMDAASDAMTSATGQMAQQTVGNEAVTALADGVTDTASSAASVVDGEGAMAEAVKNVEPTGGGGNPLYDGEAATSALADTASTTGVTASRGGSIMQSMEDFAKKNPFLTKTGLGIVQGIGNALGQSSLMKQKYQLAEQMAIDEQNRAYKGMDLSLPFQPNAAARSNLTPMQRYMQLTQMGSK